jgi:phage tail-like protein
MNSNRVGFWQLRDPDHWDWQPSQAVAYDRERGRLRLRSLRAAPEPVPGAPDPQVLLGVVPQALDAHGTRAFWHAASSELRATGAAAGSVRIDTYDDHGTTRSIFEAGDVPTDLLVGHDGVLYVAVGGRVVLVDRRDRWLPTAVSTSGFTPWRMAPARDQDAAGKERHGVWVIEPTYGRLARVRGLPLPLRSLFPHAADVFRPEQEDPDPPVLRVVDSAQIPAGEIPAALASSPSGRLAVLTHTATGAARLRLLREDHTWSEPVRLLGADNAFSLAWVRPDRVAVLVPGHRETYAYAVDEVAPGDGPGVPELLPAGDLHPLPRYVADTPFVHTVDLPPHYLTQPVQPGGPETEPVRTLPLPSYAARGEAHGAPERRFDAGAHNAVWDRLYVEGAFPDGCGAVVLLAATNEPEPPADDDSAWHAHVIGAPAAAAGYPEAPHAAWLATPTELPFHPGVLGCAAVRDRTGCFTALIQRSGLVVRALRGRYLWLRVILEGNRRATPEIAAVRAYGVRFSYRDSYLPEVYHETRLGPDADDEGAATGSDFLERFLGLFESVLTPLEDLAAQSYLVTHPAAAPAGALDWLASWLGVSLDAAAPEAQRRETVARASELSRWRGTLRGLELALDIATGGAVSGGEIVVVEDFRLRRTFATILGVDFGAVDDPLLAGPVFHGNSMLGDTMFFGEEQQKELLALFDADLPLNAAERQAVRAFFDGLAHRVTVLVHERVEDQDLGLIGRVVEREVPAHLRSRVRRATHPLIVGLTALVGVDTYLSPRPGREPLRIGASRVGGGHVLQSPGSLDPRLEGGA